MYILPKKESLTVEFKSSFSDNVIEALVAFSNAKGGTVYIGITDDGKTQGITLGKETVQNFINEIKSKTNPQIIPDIETIEIKNKTILALSAPEYPIKPVLIKGKYYKRTGDSNHLLGVEEIANEHLKTINSSWDMFPDIIHSLNEISFTKVQKCIKLMKKNGISIKETNITFLEKYNLIRNNQITNAAFLMFKKNDEVTTTIELGRFQNDITIKDSARTKSDILTQVDEVINFVKNI
jgi:ATP-dependent DNA helicase RecG